MKNFDVVTIRDGHDRSGKRTVDVVLAVFIRPEDGGIAHDGGEYMGTNYFGLPVGIYSKSITEGAKACTNVVEMYNGEVELTPIAGGGPDLNISGPTKFLFDGVGGGVLLSRWEAFDGSMVTQSFRFKLIKEDEVEGITKKYNDMREAQKSA